MPFRPSSRSEDTPRRRPDSAAEPEDPLAEPEPAENEEFPAESVADTPEDQEGDAGLDDDAETALEDAQRFPESGVKEDMATAAVYPQTHAGIGVPASDVTTLPPGGWTQLSDAEIMLRVAAGDEAGFGILVEKYRR